MIKIVDKTACCGCSACVQKCPKQCISLKEDTEGFLYPEVDKPMCIDCGLCEKVCPVLHQGEPRRPIKVYAAKNKNEEIRRKSSSGGIFTLLAEQTINEKGVVFGVRFDKNWEVRHDYTETIEGLAAFRGSKYVQSRMEDNYKKVETFLKQGRMVLFSGTPCQVAGLKRFLRKEYENLLAVDFICHGVPSPGIWRQYLKETVARMCDKNSVSTDPISKDNARVESISFRDKSSGWKKFSFSLTLSATSRSGVKNTVSQCEIFPRNTFMKGFLADLYLRPSCHICPAKSGKSGADITLGDYWGIQNLMPKLDDNQGISALVVNTPKGLQVLHATTLELYLSSYTDLCTKNPALVHSYKIPIKRKEFYANNGLTFHERIQSICRISFEQRVKLKIISLFNMIKTSLLQYCIKK